MKTIHRTAAAAVLIASAVLTACSTPADAAPRTDAAYGADAAPGADGTDGIQVRNCGRDVVFAHPPQRVMLLESAPVTILDGLGVFDTVMARAGLFPEAYYDDDLAGRLRAVPSLTTQTDPSGHILLSTEEIIARQPDAVLGLPESVSRDALEDAGIPALVQEMLCPSPAGEVSFQTLYDEVERYGVVFGREPQAERLIGELRGRVADVERSAPAGEARTGVVLYPTTDGATLYAYGAGSMADPQLSALGLRNVFRERSERVFEVQLEALLRLDPDVIVILYQGETAATARTQLESLPGAATMKAVESGRVFTQLFNFTEPASPLTVTGLEMLAAELRKSDD